MKNNIRPFLGSTPLIHPSAFIDPSAVVIGKVAIASEASVWPGVVIRGDVNNIAIGVMSNIQDSSVIHVEHQSAQNPCNGATIIGDYVTIGHKVLLHGCTIHDETLIGMGSIVLDGVVIQKHVLLGAGSLVPPGKVLQSGYLYLGSPAKKIRPLTQEEIYFFKRSAINYQTYAQQHQMSL